jgi:hypothetical protein
MAPPVPRLEIIIMHSASQSGEHSASHSAEALEVQNLLIIIKLITLLVGELGIGMYTVA